MRQSIAVIFLFSLIGCSQIDSATFDFPEGGYPYSTAVTPTDSSFYYLPVKNVMSKRDSFEVSTGYHYFLKAFQEPNLSIRPPEKPIFRLTFMNDYTGYGAVVTLTEEGIVFKQNKNGYPFRSRNYEKLTEQEESHLSLLEMYYPFERHDTDSKMKRYLEHYTKDFPKLSYSSYYRSLWYKVMDSTQSFTYVKWRVPLTRQKYRYFVNQINQSGFWAMQPFTYPCIGEVTHWSDCALEASTPQKYQVAHFMWCHNNTLPVVKVYDEILQYVKLYEHQKQWDIDVDSIKRAAWQAKSK